MSASADERIAIDIVNDLNERGLAPAKLAQWLLDHISNGDMKAEDWIALAQQDSGGSEVHPDG
jgi:hemerythrin